MAENKQNKRPNVPPLRFPEFTEPWDRNKLSCFLYENKERNKADFFSKEDVLSVSGELGIVNQIELLGRSFAGKSVKDYHIVRKGNIVYTKSPLKEFPYGIIKYNRGVDGIVSTLYAVYHVLDNADGRFIEFYFTDKGRINRYLKPIVRIGAKHDMKIGNEEVLDNYVVMPTLVEQDKIATFIELLDKRIAMQSKLIEQLESLIKGIIHHLTAESPNVRIADCLDCHSSTLQENQLKELGKCRVYGANGVCGYTDSPAINGNAILIVKDGSGVGNVSFATGEYSVIGTSNYLTAKSGYNLRYIYFCLMNFNFAPYKTGMAIPHIYFKDYGKAKIYCPALEEQERIANVLSKIERKMVIERSITNHYIEQKQYLLQQMFI